jgi:hypothetical protein
MIQKIISGGQTGADRMALDWAIWHGIPHGGWCPIGSPQDLPRALTLGTSPLRQIYRIQGMLPASLVGRSVFGNCEETIHHHFPLHMGDYSLVTRRDVFAHGDVHGLHDMRLLQKLLTARRSVQHLPVIAESTL